MFFYLQLGPLKTQDHNSSATDGIVFSPSIIASSARSQPGPAGAKAAIGTVRARVRCEVVTIGPMLIQAVTTSHGGCMFKFLRNGLIVREIWSMSRRGRRV